MSVEKVKTLIIGGGQAGLAMSEHLSKRGVPHLIVERHRIAERWRSERWDSLVANGPAWHDRFPRHDVRRHRSRQLRLQRQDRGVFRGLRGADRSSHPLRRRGQGPSQESRRLRLPCRNLGRRDRGHQRGCRHRAVSAARSFPPSCRRMQGSCRFIPPPTAIPASCPRGRCWWSAPALRAHRSPTNFCARESASTFRSARTTGLPDAIAARISSGGWGCWASGMPEAVDPSMEHVTIAVSGAYGGHTVDFRRFAARGMLLVGRAESFKDGVMHFAPDLARNIARGDADYLSVLDAADAYVARNGLDLPEEPDARKVEPDPACVVDPVRQLDLAEAGITSIVWATGYALDFGWLKVDAFDEKGRPCISGAFRRCQGFTSWGWPGCRDGLPPSSGASGTMPNTWRTISQPAARRGASPTCRWSGGHRLKSAFASS